MDLHIAFELRSAVGATPHRDLYPAMLDICAWADDQGFAYANFGEHHASASGYNPSPLVTCAAVAGRTRRIRMRPNILLAPFYNPIRLAEDTAVLSLASQGRFDIAIGGGYRQAESDLYSTDLKDRWRTVGELVEFLRKAWTGDTFEYQGRSIYIKPVPDSKPRIFLGAFGEAAARRAARIADGFAVPHSEALWEPYRQECIALGKPDPGPAQPLGPVFLWIAEDVDAAWKMLTPYVLSQIHEYDEFTTEGYGEAKGPYKGTKEPDKVRTNPAYQVLTPEQAIKLGQTLGSRGRLLFNPLMSGIPIHEAWRMLRLFETRVLPHLPT